jgi:hypothetical protein
MEGTQVDTLKYHSLYRALLQHVDLLHCIVLNYIMSIYYIVRMMSQMHAPHLEKINQQKNTSHTMLTG